MEREMTEEEFLTLVRAVCKDQDAAALDVDFDETALDSLDLLEIREELELRLQRSLTDEKFVATSTLRDLYRQVGE
jgi:acyl carrier protein